MDLCLEEEYLPEWVSDLRYSIRPAPWWAKLLMRFTGGVACTIGSRIYVRPAQDVWYTRKATVLVAHELEHVRQWRERGFIRFALRYLYEFWRYGYYGISFERMAYDVQSEVSERMETA